MVVILTLRVLCSLFSPRLSDLACDARSGFPGYPIIRAAKTPLFAVVILLLVMKLSYPNIFEAEARRSTIRVIPHDISWNSLLFWNSILEDTRDSAITGHRRAPTTLYDHIDSTAAILDKQPASWTIAFL